MKNIKKLLILLFIIAIIGCANPSKIMKSWVGHHISDLYLKWGPPSVTTPDGKGGTIVSYYYNRNLGQIPGKATKNYDGSISYTAPQNINYTAARHFYVNSNGIIYSWRWRGL